MKRREARKAFTLVELLIVISIIGVLAAMVMPAISNAMGFANKARSMNNARAIAQAWSQAARGEKSKPVYGETIYDWAFELAKRADLNDPAFWILDFDPKVGDKIAMGATRPINVGDKIGPNWKISEEFKAFPISWEVANLVNPGTAPRESPLVWTRGLTGSGSWSKEDGVFLDKGGHIAFVDMSVQWFEALRDDSSPRGVLKRYGETMPTFDIGQAIRGGSKNILRSVSE